MTKKSNTGDEFENVDSGQVSFHWAPPASEMQQGVESFKNAQGNRSSQKSKCILICGYLTLLYTLLGASGSGVIANYMPNKTVFCTNAWRNANLTFFFAPLVCLEYFYIKSQNRSYPNIFSVRTNFNILISSACLVIWTWGITIGARNLIQSQAYVFNNQHGLFIVFALLLKGIKVTRKEIIGLTLSLVGCATMLIDPKAQREVEGDINSILAAVLDISTAAFGAIYLMMSAKNGKSLPIFLLIFVMQMQLFLINGFLACSIEQNVKFFSTNVEFGVFGFLNWSDQSVLILFLQSFITGLAG